MPAAAPLLTRQRCIAFKAESTQGTAVSLTATEGVINAFDSNLVPEIETAERTAQGSLSMLAGVPGPRAGRCTFETEIQGNGSGAALPALATLLNGSAFVAASGATYKPVSGSATATTLTMGVFTDGHFDSIAGAVGKFTMRLPVRQAARIAWEFLGIYTAPTAAALITPSFPVSNPFIFQAATLTVGAYSPRVSNVEIVVDNTLTLREDATKASGYIAGAITDRRVTLTMDVEEDTLATKDWVADWLARTTAALTITLGNGTDEINITCPALQITNAIPGDRNGIYIRNLTCMATRSSTADDEIALEFASA